MEALNNISYGNLIEKDKKENFGSLYNNQKVYSNEDVQLSQEIMKSDRNRLLKESFKDFGIDEQMTIQTQKNTIKNLPGIGEVMQIM